MKIFTFVVWNVWAISAYLEQPIKNKLSTSPVNVKVTRQVRMVGIVDIWCDVLRGHESVRAGDSTMNCFVILF
jgi:hypothetical protein